MRQIVLNINDEEVSIFAEPRESLADVLRERLRLTATHLGCEHGACGACTVEVDGRATRSCLMLGVMAEGRCVRTLEGLHDDPIMVVLRRHFHEQHALQCGFCTPGMLVMARDVLKRMLAKSGAELRDSLLETNIRQEMAGQICRCTGYAGIIRAITKAAQELTHTTVQGSSAR